MEQLKAGSSQGIFIEELSREDGMTLFDRQAQLTLGITGEEFVRRWKAGEFQSAYEDPASHVAVNRLVMLLPFWPEGEITAETVE